ncbi:uncharacterized protein LOC134281957 [Saccostrea cucullata]|uniref:uncharacterized protein LOC134281957 n=1 Tax=Saccostrea cuccullata TaxID=36930 RepID=UPI002ED2CA7C
MDFYQFVLLASCIGQISMNTRKKKLTLYHMEFEKYEGATSISDRRTLDVEGSIQIADDAKILILTCKPNMEAKDKDGQLLFKKKVKENKAFRIEWRSPDKKIKGIYSIIESEAKDDMFGSSNARWRRKSAKFVPHFFISALGNRNIQATVTKSSSKSFVTVYFILHQCEPINGDFVCENAVTLKDSKSLLIKDSFNFKDKLDICMQKKPSGGSHTYDELSEEYSKFLAESFNREGFGVAEIKLQEAEKGEKRQVTVKCGIEEKYVDDVTEVLGIFIFYQPLWMIPQARVLLAGLTKTKVWTDPYNIRMFPQFSAMLKAKDASGNLGLGEEANFAVNIPLDECDALPGNFQCAMAATVEGQAKHPEHKHSEIETEIIRAVYKLQRTAAAKPTKKCKVKPKADASVSMTKMTSSALRRSDGINISPAVHWMVAAVMLVRIAC